MCDLCRDPRQDDDAPPLLSPVQSLRWPAFVQASISLSVVRVFRATLTPAEVITVLLQLVLVQLQLSSSLTIIKTDIILNKN